MSCHVMSNKPYPSSARNVYPCFSVKQTYPFGALYTHTTHPFLSVSYKNPSHSPPCPSLFAQLERRCSHTTSPDSSHTYTRTRKYTYIYIYVYTCPATQTLHTEHVIRTHSRSTKSHPATIFSLPSPLFPWFPFVHGVDVGRK